MEDKKLADFIERLKKGFPEDLWGVILFGSRARSEAELNSDYDVFVIINNYLPHKPIERQEFIMDKLRKKWGMNIIAKTKQEFESSFPSLYLDLALDGIILFDRDNYTEKKLAQITKLMEEAGLVREKRPYGFNWRWKTKPSLPWRIDWTGVYGIVRH
ncbi:MAG: nucleotidyltransferase domain-containing protein [Candidatus Edwardsbacteria bacterium]